MTSSAQGSLTMVGLNTPTPSFFWKGNPLVHAIGVVANVEVEDQQRHIRLRVSDVVDAAADAQYAEMQAAGVSIKKVKP